MKINRLIFRIAFTIATWMIAVHAYSQSTIYALTSHNDIIRIDPSNCSYQIVIPGSQFSSPYFIDFTDIAYEQGELYLCTTSLLYKINPVSGQVDFINLGNGISGIVNGLTGDQNGNLYSSGQDLKRINVSNVLLEELGTLHHWTQGDIEFINGKLYVAAQDADGNGALLEIQASPFIVSSVGPLPDRIYGMTKHHSLSNEQLFASKDSSLLILDVTTGETVIHCSNIFDDITIYGMTLAPNNLHVSDISESDVFTVFQDFDKQQLFIESPANNQYCLYNSLGQEITCSFLSNPTTIIDMSPYSSGVFYVRIQQPNGPVYQKKIVSY